MANLSFRPRQIDIDRPLPIFRREMEGEQSFNLISRSVPDFGSGMEKEEEGERHLQEVLQIWQSRVDAASSASYTSSNTNIIHPGQDTPTSVQNEADQQQSFDQSASQPPQQSDEPKFEIPTPGVKIVAGYDTDNAPPFNKPPGYIKWNGDISHCLDYDADSDDEDFLKQVNSESQIISEKKFERIVDHLEKNCALKGANVEQDAKFVTAQVLQIIPDKPELAERIAHYWIEKRGKHSNLSLNPYLYHWLNPTAPDDPSPLHAFRQRPEDMRDRRRGRKNDATTLTRLKQLRHEMEKARTLLEMVKKRERFKKEKADLEDILFDMRVIELQNVLNNPQAQDTFFYEEDAQEEILLQQMLQQQQDERQKAATQNEENMMNEAMFFQTSNLFTRPEKRKRKTEKKKDKHHQLQQQQQQQSQQVQQPIFKWSENVDDISISSEESDNDDEDMFDIDEEEQDLLFDFLEKHNKISDEVVETSKQQQQPQQPQETATLDNTNVNISPDVIINDRLPSYLQELGLPATKPPVKHSCFDNFYLEQVGKFRGRGRIGRGGRLIFDRRPILSNRNALQYTEIEDEISPRFFILNLNLIFFFCLPN